MRIKSIISFPFKYGLVATMQRIVCGRGYTPTSITDLYFHRIGGVDESTLLSKCELMECCKLTIILSHAWRGGATLYLDGLIRDFLATNNVVLLVKPHTRFCGVLSLDIYNAKGKSSFFVRSLRTFMVLAGKRCSIFINELVQWHLYDKTMVVSNASLERLFENIFMMKQGLNACMTYLVHDYYCVCPRYSLVSADGYYCGMEKRSFWDCAKCLTRQDEMMLPVDKDIDIAKWRHDFATLFSQCKEVRTFSKDARDKIAMCFPNVSPTLVPHVLTCVFLRRPMISNLGIVIGVVGNIQPFKGSRIIVQFATYLINNGIDCARIVVVGELMGVEQPIPPNIKICGAYNRCELPDIIEREGINVGFVSSICPETFSYVTHELMMLGLPIVCFNIGAQRDAVGAYAKGAIINDMNVETIWTTIESLHHKITMASN